MPETNHILEPLTIEEKSVLGENACNEISHTGRYVCVSKPHSGKRHYGIFTWAETDSSVGYPHPSHGSPVIEVNNGVVLHTRDTCSQDIQDIITFAINRYVKHVCSLERHDTGVHQCPKCSLVWGM